MANQDKPTTSQERLEERNAQDQNTEIAHNKETEALRQETAFLIEHAREQTPYRRNLRELQSRRESGEIANNDFNFIQWYIANPDKVLGKKDLGRQALVLTGEEFEQLGILEIKLPSGKTCSLDYDDLKIKDGLIIFPEELG